MKSIFTILILTIAISGFSQDYRYSAGLRGGYSSGITFQAYLDHQSAFQALMSWRDKGMQFTAMYEKYKPIFAKRSDHFFLYYGGGGHIGYIKGYRGYYYENNYYTYYEPVTRPVFGADGIVGMEFRLYSIPLAFALDYKPFIEFNGEEVFRFAGSDFAFNLKFNF